MRPHALLSSLGCAVVLATGASSLAQTPGAPAAPSPAIGVLAPPGASAASPSYDRKGRRDPFQPIEIVQPEVKPPTVASARLKGIVRGNATRALVETPDGMGYIMKLGDTLADGRLVEIRADSVVFSVASRRGPTPNHVVLRLPED